MCKLRNMLNDFCIDLKLLHLLCNSSRDQFHLVETVGYTRDEESSSHIRSQPNNKQRSSLIKPAEFCTYQYELKITKTYRWKLQHFPSCRLISLKAVKRASCKMKT